MGYRPMFSPYNNTAGGGALGPNPMDLAISGGQYFPQASQQQQQGGVQPSASAGTSPQYSQYGPYRSGYQAPQVTKPTNGQSFGGGQANLSKDPLQGIYDQQHNPDGTQAPSSAGMPSLGDAYEALGFPTNMDELGNYATNIAFPGGSYVPTPWQLNDYIDNTQSDFNAIGDVVGGGDAGGGGGGGGTPAYSPYGPYRSGYQFDPNSQYSQDQASQNAIPGMAEFAAMFAGNEVWRQQQEDAQGLNRRGLDLEGQGNRNALTGAGRTRDSALDMINLALGRDPAQREHAQRGYDLQDDLYDQDMVRYGINRETANRERKEAFYDRDIAADVSGGFMASDRMHDQRETNKATEERLREIGSFETDIGTRRGQNQLNLDQANEQLDFNLDSGLSQGRSANAQYANAQDAYGLAQDRTALGRDISEQSYTNAIATYGTNQANIWSDAITYAGDNVLTPADIDQAIRDGNLDPVVREWFNQIPADMWPPDSPWASDQARYQTDAFG